MTLFRILSIALAAGYIYVWWKWYREYPILKSLQKSWSEKFRKETDIINRIRFGALITSLVTLVMMGLSGFLPVLFSGAQISGLLLIIHATIAPLFVLAVTVYILTVVHRMRYNRMDWRFLQGSAPETGPVFWQKTHFWISFIAVIPAILAILFMLYPLFGTDGQKALLNIHRYSTFAILAAGLHHLYLNRLNGENQN